MIEGGGYPVGVFMVPQCERVCANCGHVDGVSSLKWCVRVCVC